MASLGEDLLGIVNKLQDLVFNTIGNDSLDLPQIVSELAPNSITLTHLNSLFFNTIPRSSLVRSLLVNHLYSKILLGEISFREVVG
jgi:hypothetical protein